MPFYTFWLALIWGKHKLIFVCFLCYKDFESNNELKTKVIAFLEEVMHDPELLTQERKAAANIIRYNHQATFNTGFRNLHLL